MSEHDPGPRRASREEHLAAFRTRLFLCHRCGRHDHQRRDTDRSSFPLRFRVFTDTLLVPYCARCEPRTSTERQQADVAFGHAVARGEVPWADKHSLDALICSISGCGLRWYDVGVPAPFVPFYDTSIELFRHPCPWCVAEIPDAGSQGHHATIATLAHPHRSWVDGLEQWLRGQ